MENFCGILGNILAFPGMNRWPLVAIRPRVQGRDFLAGFSTAR